MNALEEIEAAALRLTEQDRARLAEKLLSSLPAPDPMTDDEILAEAIRRDEEIENGTVKPLSAEEFWERIRRSRP